MELNNNYPSLTDKVVLITGGATGIGACLVEAFCLQKSKVAFVDVQDKAAETLIDRVQQLPNATKPIYFHCDLKNISQLQKTIETVKDQLGNIGVLINNAGDDSRHELLNTTEAYWDDRINVNLRHIFFAIQAVQPQMCALGGGSIVNFGSISWYQKHENLPVYASAKAAIEGMTRGLARQLGENNIRINTVVPGWVMTEKQIKYWVDDKKMEEIRKQQCLNSLLGPESISAMTLFLASDDSRMCTAQSYIVDGGLI